MNDDDYSDEGIARRRDDAIRRALNTPPKRYKEFVGKTERAQSLRDALNQSASIQAKRRRSFLS